MKIGRGMLKRLFAMLLALMLSVSVLDVPAYAAEQDSRQVEASEDADAEVPQKEEADTEDITENEEFIDLDEETPVADESEEVLLCEDKPELPEESDSVNDKEDSLLGAPGDVVINETNFPDPELRNDVSHHNYDKNQDGILSSTEIKETKTFSAFFEHLHDLKGLEYFTELEKLNVHDNNISEIDLSPFPKLKELQCSGNNLSTLDLTNNPALEILTCGENNLTTLDLSKNVDLTLLHCPNAKLTSLDLSKNPKVEEIYCQGNQLSSLNLTGVNDLEWLECYDNNLSVLNLSDKTKLMFLDCHNNQLEELSLAEHCNSMLELDCSQNKLTVLDVSGMPKLRKLYCHENKLPVLNVSSLSNLETLYCHENKLEELIVTGKTKLTTLSCHTNNLTTLTLSADPQLMFLSCYANQLPSLDISPISKLSILHKTVAPEYLSGYLKYRKSDKEMLCVDYTTAVTSVTDETLVATIDTTTFPDNAFRAYVSSHFDSNGDGKLNKTEAGSVTAIDDSFEEVSSLEGIKYFENLVELVLRNTNLTTLDVSGLTSLRRLECVDNEELTSLNASGCTSLDDLYCLSNGKLSSLNISGCSNLKSVFARGNQLTELNVAGFYELWNLVCKENKLTSLTLDNPKLRILECGNNNFDTLNLGNAPLLRAIFIAPDKVSFWKDHDGNPMTEYSLEDGSRLEVDSKVDIDASSIPISPANFPNANFRTFVSASYDEDGDHKLTLSETNYVTGMHCPSMDIADLKGIEFFPELKELQCYGNPLTTPPDLSKNKKLKKITCHNCSLTALDVGNCTELKYLNCYNNSLTALDLSKNPQLNYLQCYGNPSLTELDVSKNPYLKKAVQQGEYDASVADYDRYYDFSDSPSCELYVNKDLSVIATNKADNLKSLAITSPPTKLYYSEGEKFAPEGMVVTATYSDGHTAVISAEDYTVIPDGPLSLGITSVTVSYTQNGLTKTAKQNITVYEAILGKKLSGTVRSSELISYMTYDLDGNTTIELDDPDATIHGIKSSGSYNLTITGDGQLNVDAGLKTGGKITIDGSAFVAVNGDVNAVEADGGITVKGSSQLIATAGQYALYSKDMITITDTAGVYADVGYSGTKAIYTTKQDGLDKAENMILSPSDYSVNSSSAGTWILDDYDSPAKRVSIYPADTVEEITAVTDKLDFGTLVEDYTAVTPQTAVIRNTGMLTVDIEISNTSSYWSWSSPDKTRLKPGEEAKINIWPKTGLTEYDEYDNPTDHNDWIIISTKNLAYTEVKLKLEVEKKNYSFDVSQTWLDFGEVPLEAEPGISRTITVTNTGNAAQDFYKEDFDSYDYRFDYTPGYEIIESPFPCRLEPGESVNITIAPMQLEYYYGFDFQNTMWIKSVESPLVTGVVCKTDYYSCGDWIDVRPIPDQYYTGSPIKPEVVVYYFGHKLSESDYTVSYKNNTNVYKYVEGFEGFSSKKAPSVTVKGKGAYKGSITRTFTISERHMVNTEAVNDEWALPAMDPLDPDALFKAKAANITLAYNGKAQKGTCKLTDLLPSGKRVTLKAGKDYELTYPDKGYRRDGTEITGENVLKAPGLYVITVTGKGNYNGDRKLLMEIVDETVLTPVSKLSIPSIPAQTYQGRQIVFTGIDNGAKVRAKDKNGDPVELIIKNKRTKETLQVGKHYTLEYRDNIEIGTATVTIVGRPEEGYVGTVSKTFKINGTSLSKMKQEGFASSVFYDGSKKKQALKFYYTTGSGSSLVKHYLTEGTDYTVSYSNNVNTGTATVIYKGIGEYTSTVKKTFKITGYPMSTDPNNSLKVYNYTGGPATPWPAGTLLSFNYSKNGTTPGILVKYTAYGIETVLKEGVDYTVSYSNNKTYYDGSDPSQKKPTVTIKGKGKFSGSLTRNFRIDLGNLAYCHISATDMVYQNKAGICKTDVVIRDANGQALKAGTDYYPAKDPVNGFKYTYVVACNVKDVYGNDVAVAAGSEVKPDHIIPAGTALRVTVTGKGMYDSQTSSGIFCVTKASFKNAVIKIADKIYRSEEVALYSADFIEAKIKIDGVWTPLTYGTDYVVDYDSLVNGIKPGTARVNIIGKGNYGGQGNVKTVSFKIEKRNLNYKVYFFANNGSSKIKISDITYGAALPKNAFKAPAGKHFKGWSYTPTGTVVFTDKEEFRPNSIPAKNLWFRLIYGRDVGLYAIWGE